MSASSALRIRSQTASFHKGLSSQELQSDVADDGATEEQTGVALSHFETPHSVNAPLADSNPLPEAIAFLAQAWPGLPPHVRETIITLATVCVSRSDSRVIDDE